MSRITRQHLPVAACLILAAVSIWLPRPSDATPTPPYNHPPIPPPAPTSANADLQLGLGSTVAVHVAAGQALLPAGVTLDVPLAVEALGQSRGQTAPRALVLCLDRSGSMHGAPMEHLKQASAGLVEALSPQDSVALVSFSTHANVDLPLTTADGFGKAQALRVINAMVARGGTNLHQGLARSQGLINGASANAVRRVVVISDGVPTEGITSMSAMLRMVDKVSNGGMTLSTFGVGVQSPGGLMERMATSGGGNFQYLRNSSALAAALSRELSEAGQLAMQAVKVTLTLPEGVTLVDAAGSSVQRHGGNVLDVWVGDLPVGQSRRTVMTLRMVAKHDSALLFALGASGRDGTQPHNAQGTLTLVGSNNAGAVAQSVVPWVQAHAQVAQAQQEVRQAAESFNKGDRSAGRAVLTVARKRMKAVAAVMPEMAPAADKVEALEDAVERDEEPKASANRAYGDGFGLMR